MKKYKTSPILFLLLIVNFCSYGQTKVEIENELKKIMFKEHIPGLAYAVVENGKVLQKGVMGFASIPFKSEVNNETVFQLASTSKIFCSFLLGKLFDEGILNPQQTLDKIFDSIPETWKKITILQLAAHQSGIKMADFSKAKSNAEMPKIAMKQPLEYESGTKSSYISSDYWILLSIIEKVTNMKYYDALQKYILKPLNLKNTFVANPETGYIGTMDIIPQQAQEYHWWTEDSTLRISLMNFPSSSYAAGGIYSSIEDLIQLAFCFDNNSILSKETKKLISSPLYLKDGKPGTFGLGLIVRDYEGHNIIEHSGGPALADFVRFDKEKLTFIVLTNNRGTYPYLSKDLATFYIKGLPKPVVPKDYK